MNTLEEIINAAQNSIPPASPDADWLKRAIGVLVPIVAQGSLLTEESKSIQFSVAVSPAQLTTYWDYMAFTKQSEVSPGSLIKIAKLTEPGKRYLLCELHEGGLKTLGVGRPHPLFGTRCSRDLAAMLRPERGFSFVSATAIGPLSFLIEGCRTELAFVFNGILQPQGSMGQLSQFEFPWAELSSKNRSVVYKGECLPPDQLALIGFTDIIEKIARAAWFEGKGGTIVFATNRPSLRESGITVENTVPLLEKYLEVLQMRFQLSDEPNRSDCRTLPSAEHDFQDGISQIVRASTVDGAVLIDSKGRMRAFGAKLRARQTSNLLISHAAGGEPLDLSRKGTRHLSAASWVDAAKARLAMVISQDRFVRIFGKLPNEKLAYIDFRPPLYD